MKKLFFLVVVVIGVALGCERNGFDNTNDPITECKGALEEKPITFNYEASTKGSITFFYNNGQPYLKLDGKFDSLKAGDHLFEYVDSTVDTIDDDTPRSYLILNENKINGEKTFNLSKDDLKTLSDNHVVRMAGIELYSSIYGQVADVLKCFYERLQ
ncbi:hypothetical protein SAMN05216436_10432 [bacterium A37T11]|nr:hypothetical protein SAMN05216436_10432 [bacterium A37T11]